MKDILNSPFLTDYERSAVLRWRARKWVPPEPVDVIDFWEADLITPDDPVLAKEQAENNDALLRVARMHRVTGFDLY